MLFFLPRREDRDEEGDEVDDEGEEDVEDDEEEDVDTPPFLDGAVRPLSPWGGFARAPSILRVLAIAEGLATACGVKSVLTTFGIGLAL